MRHFLISTCALTMLFTAPPAAAAGGGAAEAISYTWTGPYAGINVGYGWGSSDWDFNGGSTSHDIDSGVLGLQAGYSAQVGNNLIGGLEVSLDSSNVSGSDGCGADSCKTQMRSFGDISARLGLVEGRSLLYLKGGIAYEDSTHHIISGGVDNRDNGGTSVGYLIGGGAEYALIYNLTARLEYDYTGFPSRNDYTVPPNTRISVSEPFSVIKLGFNLKFE